MRNNKGFSLVELIIVIAIMAILVGVMAPQLIKYIEKTNVSADVQLCDSVKTAVTTAVMDPASQADSASVTMINSWTSTWTPVSGLTGSTDVEVAIQTTLGYTTPGDIANINQELKSWNSGGTGSVEFNVAGSNSVHVRITGSDATGLKGQGAGFSSTADIIYVD